LPGGLFICLPIAGRVIHHFGSRKVVIAAGLLYSLMLMGIGLAHSLSQLVVVLFCFGFVSSLLNIGVNTQAAGIERQYSRPVMASFHGMWSLAGFAGAALGSLMIALQV